MAIGLGLSSLSNIRARAGSHNAEELRIKGEIIMAGVRHITLTRGAVAVVDEEEYPKLASMGRWHLSDNGYAVIRNRVRSGEKKTIRMHRVVNNTPEHLITDHLNNNKLDNRKANLRACTHVENARNRKDIVGVCWDNSKGKWMARYRSQFYGRYDTKEEAVRAYQLARSGVKYKKKDRRKNYHLPKGVFKNKANKNYQARVQINGERVYLGTFATIEEAEKAYLDRKRG